MFKQEVAWNRNDYNFYFYITVNEISLWRKLTKTELILDEPVQQVSSRYMKKNYFNHDNDIFYYNIPSCCCIFVMIVCNLPILIQTRKHISWVYWKWIIAHDQDQRLRDVSLTLVLYCYNNIIS